MNRMSLQNSSWIYLIRSFRAIVFAALPGLLCAQGTRLEMPKNKYAVEDDVKLGREAAAQAEKEFPLLRDSEIESYVNDVGQRIVSAIPAEFRQSQFRYTFKVVNAGEINAFALPGGPMFVNRGMIELVKVSNMLVGENLRGHESKSLKRRVE